MKIVLPLHQKSNTLFHSFSNPHHIDLTTVSNHLHDVQLWCDSNKLTINYSKTKFMILRPKNGMTNENFTINIDDNSHEEQN